MRTLLKLIVGISFATEVYLGVTTGHWWGLGLWMACAVFSVCYFFPTIVASRRGHANVSGILVINLLLGWSLAGWVVAMVWALRAENC